MESQPQNPEFRNNPENFHPCYGVMGSFLVCECSINWSYSINNDARERLYSNSAVIAWWLQSTSAQNSVPRR